MYRSSTCIIVFLLVFAVNVSAQVGNEWIDFNQSYYKFKIATDDYYRVTRTELEAAGFQSNVVAASRLKLFREGQEVAMLISSSGGVLNYLEFYGQKTDGTRDTDLYVSNEAQPHTLYSLFSDTSTYFLTYELTGGSGRRIEFSTDNDNTGLSAEPYHSQQVQQLLTNRYASGLQFGADSRFSLGRYDFGEGWTGPDVAKGGSETYTLQLDNAFTSGPVPELEMVMVGANGQTHLIEIKVGPNESSLRSIGTETWSDRTFTQFSYDLQWSDLSSTGALVVKMNVVGLVGVADRASSSYVWISYRDSFVLSVGEV